MHTLYLLVGYPGSGKTTTALQVQQLTGAVHLWADRIRRERYGEPPAYSAKETADLYRHLNTVAAELLASGQSVIYDTNFNFFKDRQALRDIAQQHGAEVRLLWVQAPEQLARQRATQDAEQQTTRILGNMPEATFDHLVNGLEEPRPEEQAIVIDGTKVSAEYISEKLSL